MNSPPLSCVWGAASARSAMGNRGKFSRRICSRGSTEAGSRFTSTMTIDTLVAPAAMAVAAGLVGCFAVMRRMALAADALSHVALPGIGVALALHIHPLFGATAMLFFEIG